MAEVEPLVLTNVEQVKKFAREDIKALFAEINTKLAQKKDAAVEALTALQAVTGTANCDAHVLNTLLNVANLIGERKPKELGSLAQSVLEGAVESLTSGVTARAIMLTVLVDLEKGKPAIKLAKLRAFQALVKAAPLECVREMPVIVPILTAAMWDIAKPVKKLSAQVLSEVATNLGNADVDPFVPEMILALQKPETIGECVHKLGSTAFVQTVEAPVLALTVPILVRGFAEKKTSVKRLCAKISENMTKLVQNASETMQFLPTLKPILKKLKDEVSDPECRQVCLAAFKQLLRIEELARTEEKTGVSAEDLITCLNKNSVLASVIDEEAKKSAFVQAAFFYISNVTAALCYVGTSPAEMEAKLTPTFASIMDAGMAYSATGMFVSDAMKFNTEEEEEEEVDDGLELLCDCKFTLAYGAKILLNNTRLKLKRGHRVALVGPNGCGKSTLMRAIASDNLDGFPPADEVKTVFVEHSIQGDQTNMSTIEFCCSDPVLVEMGVERDVIVNMLTEIGFDDTMKNGPITSLSGGWKMKLALGRAQLKKPDILLLDEPTNHLDVVNVKWIEDFLLASTNITSIIVSHDTKFLDNIATHVIHYEQLRLKSYVGNLTKFVEKVPSAKAYYTLDTDLAFVFPKPGFIDGVKRRTKHLVSLSNASYTYPSAVKPQFTGVSVRLSMASRVAIVGRNGAGKSTLIKLVTGETVADKGSGVTYRHPNLKMAYVAQHAFHHIEQHLEKTPNEYIRWRFHGGQDKENMKKTALKLTPEELELMATVHEVAMEEDPNAKKKKKKDNKEKRVIEKIVSRRKNKKEFDYEVKWVDKPADLNTWYTRLFLERYGWKKILDDVDRKAVEAMGKFIKPLTLKNVEEHLAYCGLEREFASHNRIKGLSGGQKVKVVLAAAMWDQPHILLLDEPTNFLDRESLAALAAAINEFEGGVVVITHHREFRDAVTKTSWIMENNTLTVQGDDEDWFDKTAKVEVEEEKEEMTDAMGNTIKIEKQAKALSKKEVKKLKKQYKKLKKAGADVSHLEDIFIDLDIDF